MIGKVYIEFLDQPLDGDHINYVVNTNGTPLLYDNGLSAVTKTFGEEVVTNPFRGHINRVDDDFEDDPTFNEDGVGFDSDVYALLIRTGATPSLYVGGAFTTYNGDQKQGIRRLDLDGNIINQTTSLNGLVYTLAQDNTGRILAGGTFSYNTSALGYNKILRMHSNLTPDLTFQQGSGFGGAVHKIAVQSDGKILVGGTFIQYNGIPARRFARLNADGTLDTAFMANMGTGFDYAVKDFHYNAAEGHITIVGDFRSFNGQNAYGICQLWVNGTRNNNFGVVWGYSHFPNGAQVRTIAYDEPNNCYYVGGYFSSYNGNVASNLVRIGQYGAHQTDFNPVFNLPVNKVILNNNNEPVVGGNFTQVNGEGHLRAVRFAASTGNTTPDVIVSSGVNGYNGPVFALVKNSAGDIIAGGSFTSVYTTAATPYDIPIGDDVVETQANTLANLTTFNTNPNITYESVGNRIEVTIVAGAGDELSYTDIQDEDERVIIYFENLVPNAIEVITRPQDLAPAYNPLVFTFRSPNYQIPSFKYLAKVRNRVTGEDIAKFRIAPELDGSGWMDISKIISNLVSADFHPELVNNPIQNMNDATRSYINYDVILGEQYFAEWSFQQYQKYGVAGVYENSVMLLSDSTHFFQVGDQISISTSSPANIISGLFEVVAVPNLTSIVINHFTLVPTPTPAVGLAHFADNRSVAFENVTKIENLTAFNGALPWTELYKFSGSAYTVRNILDGVDQPNQRFLTSLPDNFYMTPTQDLWVNVALDVDWSATTGSTHVFLNTQSNLQSSPYGYTLLDETTDDRIKVMQVNLSPRILYPSSGEELQYIDFWIRSNGKQGSEKKRIYLNHRCKISDYEIAFLDKMGSVASFAFPLRSNEKGQIERNSYKQHLPVTSGPDGYSYQTYGRGTRITNVNVDRTFELSTDWITDEMSVYFEELLSSGYTWLKINGEYFACTVEDKSFETTRAANTKLIRRTITVSLANNDAINA